MADDRVGELRYFWSGWFEGQSYALLATVFTLLSFVDLLATLRMMPEGVREGNALADYVLQHYHKPGFIALKVTMVLIVLLCTWVVEQKNARASRLVLWAGCLIMSVVALRHVAIVARFIFHEYGLFGF